ncbi:putative membrane protein [Halopolyspora algeriensis]|uniref:Putative membrane protein n=1 Tax=Halopolyspora algeriensis TaxID=1500506 RepID=A0A368VEE0_9ACTN|nr:YhgE/Pip domain-containing protein [Halopolyspora algeriensis]RCW39518.1 putative membrane protein [Halopolyspora algeriensis]TQM56169.1 putative membrane protein [Halopolyspora algeriensis]
MTTFRLARTELRRLTSGRLPKLALLGVTLVPLLYGALYIYANWNPHEKLDSVPAALVVEDRGATREDGSRLDAGREIRERLEQSGAFTWHEVERQEATRGVSEGRYTFAMIVPEQFSEALLSPADFEPRRARLQLVTNDANNYLVGTIAGRVVSEVREAIAEDAGTQAAEQLLLGFTTVHGKTVEAAEGAGKLADGARELRDGAGRAERGADRLSTGAQRILDGQHALLEGAGRLRDGAERLADGTAQVHDGLRKLRRETASLPERAAALAEGAQRVADGVERQARYAELLGKVSARITDHRDEATARLADRLRRLGVGDDVVDAALESLERTYAPLEKADDAVRTPLEQQRALADGARRVAEGARTLADATPAMTDAIARLTEGSGRAAKGADDLASGANHLHRAQQQALRGTEELADGAERLAAGTDELAGGSKQLADGSRTLATELDRGARDIPHPDEQTSAATARTIGNPVAVDEHAQVSARTYGEGLAPYFLGLALWIGGFVLFLLMRPLSHRALAAGIAPWRTALGGWFPAAGVGTVQAVLLYATVVFGVGVRPASPWWTLGFLVLTSLAFTAVVHSLNAAFGPRGKFIALVFLVLQLVTAGGTFPWQTIPEPLHPLHQVLPLSYVVDGLRHLLYGGEIGNAIGSAGVLLCYLAAGLLLSTVAAFRQRFWTAARLKPELTL